MIGEPENLRPLDGQSDGLSISKSGVLALGISGDDDNLWRVDIKPDGAIGEPTRVTNETVRKQPSGHF